MKFLDSPTWRFLKDISEIVSFLILLISGVLSIGKYINNLKLGLIINIVICVIVITIVILAGSLLYRIYNNSKDKLRASLLTTKLSATANSANVNKPEQLIPRAKFVENTFEFIHIGAKRWSSDAVVRSENLYLDVNDSDLEITFQAYYYSANKNLVKTYYIRSKNNIMNDVIEEADNYAWTSERLIDHKGWRSAVIKCIDSVHESLPSKYHIAIQVGHGGLTTSISYLQSKVNKKVRFIINNDEIFNETLNRKIS